LSNYSGFLLKILESSIHEGMLCLGDISKGNSFGIKEAVLAPITTAL
jgi:hypothetical protein